MSDSEELSDDPRDDAVGTALEEQYEPEYNSMVKRRKKKNKKKKLKHAYQADARIWCDETKKWADKIDWNRGDICTAQMLLTELNASFYESEEGRKRLKAERVEAKRIYHANVQENNETAKQYPGKYCLGSKLPRIKGNLYRLIEMFGQYVYDRRDLDAAMTRKENAMKAELHRMRKRIWAYRKFYGTDRTSEEYQQLLDKADEKFKFYDSGSEEKQAAAIVSDTESHSSSSDDGLVVNETGNANFDQGQELGKRAAKVITSMTSFDRDHDAHPDQKGIVGGKSNEDAQDLRSDNEAPAAEPAEKEAAPAAEEKTDEVITVDTLHCFTRIE